MLGQLQESGNTTTLAHYLKLLEGSGLLVGLHKYAGQKVRQRASSPRLLVLNTALMSACAPYTFEEARTQPEFWGRLVESAVGAWLVNATKGPSIEVFYWSSRNREVDFVLAKGNQRIAIEVKSTRRRTGFSGMEAFAREFPGTKTLLVGGQGIPLKAFLSGDVERLFD